MHEIGSGRSTGGRRLALAVLICAGLPFVTGCAAPGACGVDLAGGSIPVVSVDAGAAVASPTAADGLELPERRGAPATGESATGALAAGLSPRARWSAMEPLVARRLTGAPSFAPRDAWGAAPRWLASWMFAEEGEAEPEPRGRRGWSTVLLWIPNRILDALDVARARVRVGLGTAFDVRATELADVFLGSYVTVYAGLPGPRGGRMPRSPLGLESRTGVEASVADVTIEGFMGPDYGLAEIGLGLQLLIVGFDVGVDPLEAIDLVLGVFTLDLLDDDL